MSRMGSAGMTASLREIRDMIKRISKDIDDIREHLELKKDFRDTVSYPLHNLPEDNTSYTKEGE